ncbi:hypothetical protein MBM_09570 [Drepanopeziza brunnea f. sp. 'multigermtubi' MB_m1]|uniref:Uncharacterized protein n=1 Tax=Marssonina brunnea f. sp. multigermtubi (strain MB_m1) TaxID=1072389 RepID=K1XIH4_MARBU|nr:uncharacterized protein MBM_09570 [Drepanopeziza brunnea f. sp. 'multigermtubi' MB_m1]EKD12249.1 hypothetical protein MBM_09570 [Drepanopeziza brunnea f. sp. 'multigermtubi' MB_m1]
MIAIKAFLVAVFCVDSDEAKVICDKLDQNVVKYVQGRCELPSQKYVDQFSAECWKSDKNRFGPRCRDSDVFV